MKALPLMTLAKRKDTFAVLDAVRVLVLPVSMITAAAVFFNLEPLAASARAVADWWYDDVSFAARATVVVTVGFAFGIVNLFSLGAPGAHGKGS